MHYSWDWNNIHFVSLGISPGTTTHPYDPEQSIVFAAEDLKKNVGDSGRPVILLHHFGFDPHSLGWWPEAWRVAYFDLIKDYNVLAIIHGHAHESFIYQWNGFDVYHPPHFRQKDAKKNIGPVLHGFFVFHIHGDEMTVAERKLDDTWGLTARKQIDKAARPPRPFVPDSQSQFGERRRRRKTSARRGALKGHGLQSKIANEGLHELFCRPDPMSCRHSLAANLGHASDILVGHPVTGHFPRRCENGLPRSGRRLR